jgi:hypothetical protein
MRGEGGDPPAWLLRVGVAGLLALAWGRFLAVPLGDGLAAVGGATVLAAGAVFFALLLRRGR